MKHNLISTRIHSYAGQNRPIGTTYEASLMDARVLVAIGKAKWKDGDPMKSPVVPNKALSAEQPQQPAQQPKGNRKNRYQNRAMSTDVEQPAPESLPPLGISVSDDASVAESLTASDAAAPNSELESNKDIDS